MSTSVSSGLEGASMRLPRELFVAALGNPPRRHAQVILIRQRPYARMREEV